MEADEHEKYASVCRHRDDCYRNLSLIHLTLYQKLKIKMENDKVKIKNGDAQRLSFESFVAKIELARKKGSVDLSTAEDLSLAVMNLVSLEEHFYFTAMKTGKDGYMDTAAEVREMRKELLAKLMPNHEG